MPWDIWVDVEDIGMDVEYSAYWAEHPFPQVPDLGEPIEGDGGDGDDSGDGRGKGRRQRWGAIAERRVAHRRDGGEERQVHVVRGKGGLSLQVPAAQVPKQVQGQGQPQGQNEGEVGGEEEDKLLSLREIYQGQGDEI